MKVKDLVLCSFFITLIILGAFLKIAIPPLPMVFTMQTFFVILASYVLGSKKSVISVGIYILLGLVGLPVFSTGGGLGYVLSPTFGFLIGFLCGAYVCGKMTERKKTFSISSGMAALVIIYTIGALYFYLIQNMYLGQSMSVWAVISSCVLVFLPFDVICVVFAAVVARKIKKAKII